MFTGLCGFVFVISIIYGKTKSVYVLLKIIIKT